MEPRGEFFRRVKDEGRVSSLQLAKKVNNYVFFEAKLIHRRKGQNTLT